MSGKIDVIRAKFECCVVTVQVLTGEKLEECMASPCLAGADCGNLPVFGLIM